MDVLVIAAHPDDEVLGMGGTIARHRMMGDRVHCLVVTEGASQQYKDQPDLIEIKRQQGREANAMLGLDESDVIYMNLPDMRLDSMAHVEINAVIERVIADYSPALVYTNHPVLTYAPLSSTEWMSTISGEYFIPNYFVNIADTIEKKIAAFEKYKLEHRPYPHPRNAEGIRIHARAVGLQVGMEYAESFCLIRQIRR